MARDLGTSLNSPGWAASAIVAAGVTALFTFPTWPGLMSYDSHVAYQQSREGVFSMLWPPLHAYLFTLARSVGADIWGLFVTQTFLLFAAANLVIHMLTPGRRLAAGLSVCFALAFIYIPTLLGSVFAHWRDTPTASFAVLGLALWLLAARYRAGWLLPVAVLAFAVAVGLRYNAFVLVAFVMALMVWSPLLDGRGGRGARAMVAVALVAGLALAWGSTQWRLPDLRRMPNPGNLAGTQLFDVIGISACADRNFLPPEVSGGRAISAYHVRRAYDPRHLQLALADKPGQPMLKESGAKADIPGVWRRAVLAEPVCYLDHRRLVAIELMGMSKAAVYYPVHATIDVNAYGLKLTRPRATFAAVAYIERNAPEGWRRPYLLYLGALLATAAALALRRPAAPLMAALMAGVLAYPALLFLAAPAADARYIFPSSVMALLLMVAGTGVVLGPRLAERSSSRGKAATR